MLHFAQWLRHTDLIPRNGEPINYEKVVLEPIRFKHYGFVHGGDVFQESPIFKQDCQPNFEYLYFGKLQNLEGGTRWHNGNNYKPKKNPGIHSFLFMVKKPSSSKNPHTAVAGISKIIGRSCLKNIVFNQSLKSYSNQEMYFFKAFKTHWL